MAGLILRVLGVLASAFGLAVSSARAQSACNADLDQDGVVSGNDLAIVLSSWGSCSGCSGDSNSDGAVDGVDLALVLTRWGAVCPATIASVDPPAGTPGGGTVVIITGTRLGSATAVLINGVPCTNVEVLSPTALRATTPPGPPGVAVLSVVLPTGPLDSAFIYSVPVPWATVLDYAPDPLVVTDGAQRKAISATGLPWRVRDNASQIELLLIPPGSFDMGCSPGFFFCHQEELPVHTVTFTSPFYMGRYEVTQAQWTALTGSNPSYFAGINYPNSAQRPVDNVSWIMASEFAGASGLRLPTEAEWEYAYRAGTTTSFHAMPGFPNGTESEAHVEAIAWYALNSESQTQPVGLRAANGFGLHDMSGNVNEWVSDWWSSVYYAMSAAVNPPGPSKGVYRVHRGGSWGVYGSGMRASSRGYGFPSYADYSFGFRVARNP